MGVSDIQKNKEVVLQFYNHLMAREFDAAMQMLDQDIEWWTNGSESFSGTHSGRDTVTALFAPLRDHVAVLKFTFGAFTAEEDRVAFEMVSESKMTNGLDYNNTYHFLFWIQDGKIKRVREYLDTAYTRDIFSAQAG
jgi:ketosteroid isomerase-like protein